MAFRPKNGILSAPKLPPGQYYEDTLENFLKPRLDKVHSKVVVLDSSRELEAPHTQEDNEETQKRDTSKQ